MTEMEVALEAAREAAMEQVYGAFLATYCTVMTIVVVGLIAKTYLSIKNPVNKNFSLIQHVFMIKDHWSYQNLNFFGDGFVVINTLAIVVIILLQYMKLFNLI